MEDKMNFKSVNDVLEFAIAREEESHAFYMDLAGRMDNQQTKALFEGFAREEMGHKAKIEGIKQSRIMMPADKHVQNMKMADYMVDVTPSDDMDYQDALILAMKKEKMAFKLYSDLASNVDDPDLETTFRVLAQEEAKHKLRFELEYDDFVLTEN
jgi:rubrerythrin